MVNKEKKPAKNAVIFTKKMDLASVGVLGKKLAVIIFAVSLVIIGIIYVLKTSQKKDSSQNFLYSLEFENLNRETVYLSKFKGKNLVINSWAIWCPFCKKELLDFSKVQEKFKDKITIIAINRGESLKDIKDFINSKGLEGKLIFLSDKNDKFYKFIGGFSMPETIFVNKSGKIVFHKRGPLTEKEITNIIKKYF